MRDREKKGMKERDEDTLDSEWIKVLLQGMSQQERFRIYIHSEVSVPII